MKIFSCSKRNVGWLWEWWIKSAVYVTNFRTIASVRINTWICVVWLVRKSCVCIGLVVTTPLKKFLSWVIFVKQWIRPNWGWRNVMHPVALCSRTNSCRQSDSADITFIYKIIHISCNWKDILVITCTLAVLTHVVHRPRALVVNRCECVRQDVKAKIQNEIWKCNGNRVAIASFNPNHRIECYIVRSVDCKIKH